MNLNDIKVGGFYLTVNETFLEQKIIVRGVAHVTAIDGFSINYDYYDEKGNLMIVRNSSTIWSFPKWAVMRVKPNESIRH